MTTTRVRGLAFGSLAVSVTLSVGAVAYLVKGWSIPLLPTEFGAKGYSVVFALAIGGIGAVIAVRQPRNAIGWIFCEIGIIAGSLAFSEAYARWAVIREGGAPAGALYAAWLQEWIWIPMIGGLAVVAAIFPDGHFLSPRWRRAIVWSIAAAVMAAVLTAAVPRLTVYEGYDNPVGIGGSTMQSLADTAAALLLPLMVIGAAAAVVRFRRSSGETRQQLKWLALSMTFVAVLITFYGLGALVSGTSNPSEQNWAEYLSILSFLSVPVSIAFGVLKYRLYDIDIVITKAVVYGGLAAFITVVYVAIVVGVGAAIGATNHVVLSAAAAAVVALAFQPARRRAQRFANRIIYGERATPYQVLAELGGRLAGEYAVDDVVQRVATTLANGIGAERAAVWLHVEAELRPVGAWPPGEPVARVPLIDLTVPAELDGMRAVAVRHQGEVLGAIGVRKAVSDPITPADEKLLGDLAAQAGLVLRNVRLVEDLRASRQRLVATQDEERRRIERNIHDGAQQQLVALAVKIRLADTMVGRDEDQAHELLAQAQADASDALSDLRDLAHGIYPPLLADKGLVSALESQARKATFPVRLQHHGVGRYRPESEAAVYFCVLEALQNIGKYAAATLVQVRLEAQDGVLRFAVEDDGGGFDARKPSGAGLTNMRDRLDALGGSLTIRSEVGRGTTISGEVPVGDLGDPALGALHAVNPGVVVPEGLPQTNVPRRS
ncbi:MAG: histidine kinase [Actinomycetota bacterium]